MSDHDELESSVAPWVLGALDDAEAAAIDAHVDGCATCREVAVRLRRVVGTLPLAVEEVTPPPRLRERVLAGAAAGPAQAPPVAVPVRRPPTVRRPIAVRVPIYAAAAVAALALLSGLLIGQAFRATTAPAPSQVARFMLNGHQGMSGAQASVIDLKTDGLALVDFRGLPPPGAGRVYQVWLIRTGSSPEPVAVFVPDASGAGVVVVDRSLQGYSIMAVTNEPGPQGSSAPTQQPELYGSVA